MRKMQRSAGISSSDDDDDDGTQSAASVGTGPISIHCYEEAREKPLIRAQKPSDSHHLHD